MFEAGRTHTLAGLLALKLIKNFSWTVLHQLARLTPLRRNFYDV